MNSSDFPAALEARREVRAATGTTGPERVAEGEGLTGHFPLPIVVCDPTIIQRHAQACGIEADIRNLEHVAQASWSTHRLNVLACAAAEAASLDFATSSAPSGRAALAFCRAAIRAALAGEVDAVVAAPQNQTSISLARVAFDGYPSRKGVSRLTQNQCNRGNRAKVISK